MLHLFDMRKMIAFVFALSVLFSMVSVSAAGSEGSGVTGDSVVATASAVTDVLTDPARIKDRMDRFSAYLKSNQHIVRIDGRDIKFRELADSKEITSGLVKATARINISLESIAGKPIVRAILSNGRLASIKYMPDTASEVALNRLGTKCMKYNCTVELKEVGEGNEAKLVYTINTEKEAKLFGLISKKMKVMAQVNAENGQIISAKGKSWWAFLATEEDASYDEIKADLGLN